MPGRLFVCATPIGNLEDVTLRLLRTLAEVDAVAAEDTRRTRKLLTHYGIHAHLVSYHEANEAARTAELVDRLRNGQRIALVTDAGMPAVSDPGWHLVRACIEEGIAVEVIPGPSAVLTALVASGLPPARFAFEGFLSRKPGERRRRLEAIAEDDRTLVFFEAPGRVVATLQAMLACLLWIFQIPTSVALNSDTEKTVRAATFEFRAPASEVHSKDLVGSAFAIGANEFVTAAHLFDRAIGSHFGHPVLMDLSHAEYRVADILQFSEQQDYIVFSLERPPRVKPLPIRQSEHTELDLYFAGWRSDGRVVIEHGTFSGVTRDKEPGQADWLRFSGSLWGGVGGGPLLDGSGRVVGIVQARARNGDANYAVPVGVLPPEGPGRAHIHAMEMLRSLMPVVSSVTPLEADIPLPMSFDRFSHELGQLRLEYFEREIGPLLEATRRNFVLRGDGAADVCNLLNGKNWIRAGIAATSVPSS